MCYQLEIAWAGGWSWELEQRIHSYNSDWNTKVFFAQPDMYHLVFSLDDDLH